MCLPLGLCEKVYLYPARCDSGAREPKTPKCRLCFYNCFKDLFVFVLVVFKGKLQISHCDYVARKACSAVCVSTLHTMYFPMPGMPLLLLD